MPEDHGSEENQDNTTKTNSNKKRKPTDFTKDDKLIQIKASGKRPPPSNEDCIRDQFSHKKRSKYEDLELQHADMIFKGDAFWASFQLYEAKKM